MRIDLPQCDLKTCRYCFDGNCINNDRYGQCNYTIAIDNCKRLLSIAKGGAKVYGDLLREY